METVSRIAGIMSLLLGIGMMVMLGAMLYGSSVSFGGFRMDPEIVIMSLICLFLWVFSWLLAYILFFWTGWVRKKTGSQLAAFD